MTLSSGPWWWAPVLALAWMWTVPAQIFCAPTRAKLIAAARFMPGVCGVLVSSWSPGMTLTPWVFQSTRPASCCSLIVPAPKTRRCASYGSPAPPSRDRHAAVDRQHLAGDEARLVRGEIKRHVGDVLRLDQPEQVRVGELSQRGVAGNQPLDPLGHCRRGCDRVDPHLLRRIGDRQRTGNRCDAALRRGVAVAAGDAHQRDIRRHVDDRAAARLDKLGDAEPAAEKGAEEIELDGAPELVERRVDRGVVP